MLTCRVWWEFDPTLTLDFFLEYRVNYLSTFVYAWLDCFSISTEKDAVITSMSSPTKIASQYLRPGAQGAANTIQCLIDFVSPSCKQFACLFGGI